MTPAQQGAVPALQNLHGNSLVLSRPYSFSTLTAEDVMIFSRMSMVPAAQITSSVKLQPHPRERQQDCDTIHLSCQVVLPQIVFLLFISRSAFPWPLSFITFSVGLSWVFFFFSFLKNSKRMFLIIIWGRKYMILLETPLEHSQGGLLINQIMEGLIVQPFSLASPYSSE